MAGAPAALAERLERCARTAGLDAVGFAPAEPFDDTRAVLEERKAAGLAGSMAFTYRNPERSCDPRRILDGARTLVVGALDYDRADGASPTDGSVRGRVARYAREDHYSTLRAALGEVAEQLRAEGHRAIVVADDNALVDRAAAARAGIGWYGKNSSILLPDRGSCYVLGAVVTDAELPAATPVGDGCGSCRRCLTACPTGALTAPGVLDARRCLAWLLQAPGPFPRELREAVGDRIYGCDDCQDACPVNLRAARRNPPPPPGPGARTAVDVLHLLAADDAEVLAVWGRWYIAERDPNLIRRNALLVLGNTADGSAPEVEAALRRSLASPSPIVREHAAWAADRLGRRDLAAAASSDPDPEVRAGWARPAAVG